jgi:hypothetical protein
MSTNNYAVEIYSTPSDAWYSSTNIGAGLYNGVFRFVTGHPQYDGTTVVPTFGPDEIDINGNSVGGANNTNVYTEGMLLASAITGNPSRSIDISLAGSYSIDSSFSFQLRGDSFINVSGILTPFWQWCIESNVAFTGRTVIIWAIIDNVFCQIGRGRVSGNPEAENSFEFDVDDDAQFLHKSMPSLISNPTNTPSGPDSGTAFPIVFGDVVNTKLLKLQQANSFIELNPGFTDPYIATADTRLPGYSAYSITNNGTQGQLVLNLNYMPPNINYFTGMYLSVVSGEDANTDKVYRIQSSRVFVSSGSVFLILILDECLIDSSSPSKIISESTFNSSYAFNPSSPDVANMANRWWFQISPMSIDTCVTQNQNPGWSGDRGFGGLVINPETGLPYLRSWDSSSKIYDDLSNLVNANSNGNLIQLICNSASSDGKIQVYENIAWPLTGFGISNSPTTDRQWSTSSNVNTAGVPSIVGKPLLSLVTDRKRDTWVTFTIPYIGPIYPQPTTMIAANFCITNPLIKTYDDIFLVVDFTVSMGLSGSHEPKVIIGPFQGNVYDIFGDGFDPSDPSITVLGNFVPASGTTSAPSLSNGLSPNSTHINGNTGEIFKVNLILNSYYQGVNINSDANTFFGSPDGSNTYPISTFVAMSQLQFGSGNKALDLLQQKWIGSLSLFIPLVVEDRSIPTGVPLAYQIDIKQIALIGVSKIDTISGDIYTSVSGGEKTNTSGAVSTDPGKITNDVYHAIMHILEDLDGIPKGLIDYGTLATTRGTGAWHIGRTITDRKNSVDYLNELCSHSFVGMFSGRTGKRALRSWLSTTLDGEGNPVLAAPVVTAGNGKTTTHDNSLIVDQSIDSWDKSDISNVYNSFNLQYNFDPGSNNYLRNFIVSALDTLGSFPSSSAMVNAIQEPDLSSMTLANVIANGGNTLLAGSLFYLTTTNDTSDSKLGASGAKGSALAIGDCFEVNPEGATVTYVGPVGLSGAVASWYQAFGGLLNTSSAPGDPTTNTGYLPAKQIWNLCQTSYLIARKNLQAQSDISELPWFIDRRLFDPTSSWGTGVNSSAFLLLTLLSIWATQQKDLVSYAIPLNHNTYGTELLDCINFNDAYYTGGSNRTGWVCGVEVDAKNNQLKIDAILLPQSISVTPVTPPVIENVTFPAGSNVSNSRIDAYSTPSASHVQWGVGQVNVGTLVYTTNNPPTGDDDYTIDSTGKKVILNPTKWYDTILANVLGLLNMDTY